MTQPLGGDADDPAAFLAASVHEIFDEYFSVSLSFWTKMGLKEKARQGLLTGSLPWGYRKGDDTSGSYTAAMGESHPHFHAHMVPRYATMPRDAKAWSVFAN